MTLKEYLKENKIILNGDQRFLLGKKIAIIWDSQKRGNKNYIQEDGHRVNDYTISFLKHKSINRNIIRFLTNLEKEVDNG
ncbi:MAG: hypothetical protein QM499_00825 [Flavobacteriaceae bacterium]